MAVIVTCFHMLLEQALTFLQNHVRSLWLGLESQAATVTNNQAAMSPKPGTYVFIQAATPSKSGTYLSRPGTYDPAIRHLRSRLALPPPAPAFQSAYNPPPPSPSPFP